MYTVGNEAGIATDPNLLAKVNTYIAFARQYSLTKWGRKIPFTHAIQDMPGDYENLFQNLDVDIFTTNAGYRGLGFYNLWDGEGDSIGPMSRKYNKPNFIGEMGWMQINGTETRYEFSLKFLTSKQPN